MFTGATDRQTSDGTRNTSLTNVPCPVCVCKMLLSLCKILPMLAESFQWNNALIAWSKNKSMFSGQTITRPCSTGKALLTSAESCAD